MEKPGFIVKATASLKLALKDVKNGVHSFVWVRRK